MNFQPSGGSGGGIGSPGAVIAAGSTQATAALVGNALFVITSQSGGNGVQLNTLFPWCYGLNRCGATSLIYPPSGDQIEGTAGANFPVQLANNSNVIFERDMSTSPPTWRT